jgi:ligand-binding sensor domain-containing protein/signal transduction histidine kinase
MEEGLSQSTILAITQDQEEFLWLGTQEGLNRYDGYEFKVYKFDPHNTNSISDNWITSLEVDKNGNLWIGTNAGGVNFFDRNSNSFIKYRHNELDPGSLSDDRVLSVFEDRNGIIWVGTIGGGLNRFDPENNRFDHFNFNESAENLSGKYDVTSITEDSAGNLWWGTGGDGLYCFNWKNSKLRHYKNDTKLPSSLGSDQIISLYAEENGKIWIGTNGGGLNLFDPKTGKFKRYEHDSENHFSISNDHVYVIFKDSDGVFWIGTDDGLNQFNPVKGRFYHIKSDPADPISLTNNLIRSIYQDHGGILWVGTYSGALNKFDRKKAVFKNYRQNPAKSYSLSDKNVWAICQDKQGYTWVGTNHGLNRLDRNGNKFKHYFNDPDDPNSLSHNLVRTIYQDRAGDLWIGTEGGGLNWYNVENDNFVKFVYDPKNRKSISDNGLRHIFEDAEGSLWIATINGLNKFDRKKQAFKRYIHDPNDKHSISGNHVRYIYQDKRGAIWVGTFNGLSLYIKKTDNFISFRNNPSNVSSLSNDRVLCMHEDRQGDFWIGTYGGGLDKLDRDEFIFTHYSSEDGLPNNSIYGILEDSDGILWLSSNQGLSRFNPQNGSVINYDSNDGIQGNEFNGNAFYKNKRGEMFFGGINGFTRFLPSEVRNNDHVPPIVLTSFKKYDKEVYLEKALCRLEEIELSYRDKFFSFEFAALDFTNPQKNQYSYMLEGFDKGWISSGTRRYANFTNLSGGVYNFRVKGANNDGVWNEEGISIRLKIQPPFWQAWWFKIILVILILFLIYLFITLRMKAINSQKRKLELEVAQRTRELNQSNYELLRAKRDTDDILNNVEEGIFLLNSKFEIGSQYSHVLDNMLYEQEIAGRDFLEILDKKVDSKIVKNTGEYLELMFKGDVDELTMYDLNPLVEIELNLTDENNAWMRSTYLSFNFKRICEEGEIQNLIVTVTDVTEQIVLTKKLRISEERTQHQMEWLVNILHLEPALLNEFLEGAESELKYIDSLLKNAGGNGNFHHILEELYRSIHMIKGNAALLDLKFFVDLTHQFEEKISEVKRNSEIKGKDFVPLVLQLGDVRRSLREVRNLIEKISHFHQHFKKKKQADSSLLIKSINNLVKTLSEELAKEVEFNYSNFEPEKLPYQYRLLIKEILIQLVRNSFSHGIESPEERIGSHKRSLATISLCSEISKNNFIFRYRDDGRGIQLDKLKELAQSQGRLNDGEFKEFTDSQLAQLIFESGFTTQKIADSLGGRGIGLDLIQKKLKQYRGTIQVEFEADKYTEFVVTIPVKLSKKTRVSKKINFEKIEL